MFSLEIRAGDADAAALAFARLLAMYRATSTALVRIRFAST
jgi:hypothetical protein